MPTRYVESPEVYGQPSLFLAGGITNCPDWQSEMVGILDGLGSSLVLVNPRCRYFDVTDKSATERQIAWEYRMLRRCDGIMFWFAKETIQPIALFELGGHLMVAGKPIFVGTHEDYPRRVDVEVQTRLIRPDIKIAHSLSEIGSQIVAWEFGIDPKEFA